MQKSLVMLQRAACLFLFVFTLLSAFGSCDDEPPSPRIHIYDLPSEFAEPTTWFGTRVLLPYLRNSKVRCFAARDAWRVRYDVGRFSHFSLISMLFWPFLFPVL